MHLAVHRQIVSAYARALGLTAKRPFFNCDKVVEDPTHPGYVWRFVDHNDPTHFLQQDDHAKQVAMPAVDPATGRLAVTFTGVELYDSNRPASYWTFRHNGISHEECCVFTPTLGGTGSAFVSMHDTTHTVSGRSGSYLGWFGPTSNTWRASVQNAAAQVAQLDNGFLEPNAPTYVGLQSLGDGTTGGSVFTKWMKGLPSTMTTGVTPLATAPDGPLRLGARRSNIQFAQMRWHESAFFPSLTTAQRAVYQQYVRSAYRIKPYPDLADILTLSAGLPVFTADLCIEDPTHLGYVLRIVDHNDPTHWLEQTDHAKQVAMPLPHADFGGKLCFTFTLATQTYQSNRTNADFSYAHNGSPGVCTFALIGASAFSGFAPIGLSTCDLGSGANGAGICVFHQNAGGWRIVVSDGATYTISNTATGGVPTGQSRIVANLATAATPDVTIYRNGASVATANAGGALATGNSKTPAIFGGVGSSNGFIQRTRAFGYMPFLSASDLATLDAWMQVA